MFQRAFSSSYHGKQVWGKVGRCTEKKGLMPEEKPSEAGPNSNHDQGAHTLPMPLLPGHKAGMSTGYFAVKTVEHFGLLG